MVCLINSATPTLSIQLDCGQTVSVEAFLYDQTYAGLLEGSPNENLNAWFIEQALSSRKVVGHTQGLHDSAHHRCH